METVAIKKPQDRSSATKLYARVPSRSRQGVMHIVTFVRTKGTERWNCTCEDQVITRTPKRQHCYHIKLVRFQSTPVGRKVGKRPILRAVSA